MNDRLRADVAFHASEVSAMQSRLKDAQIALSESQSQMLPKEYELTKLQLEKDVLTNKLRALDEGLEKHNKDTTSFRSGADTKIFALETALSQAKAELDAKVRHIGALTVSSSSISMPHSDVHFIVSHTLSAAPKPGRIKAARRKS